MAFLDRVRPNGFPAVPGAPAVAGASGAGNRVVSGEAVEFELRVARIGSRALALLLDIAVQIVIAVLLMMVVEFALIPVGLLGGVDGALFAAIVVVITVASLIGYPVLMETFAGGRTLGKLALGLRAVRDDGGPIRFRHALTRGLVGVAVEWPGVIFPPVTWAVCVWTMLVNPQGKRVGDLAAGTLVIHERAPYAWGWYPRMPAMLAGWAATVDLSGLDDDLALAARHFLSRYRRIREPSRDRLGRSLAAEVAARTTPPPPPGIPASVYLAAVLAERHNRAVARLARARAVTASVWRPDSAG